MELSKDAVRGMVEFVVLDGTLLFSLYFVVVLLLAFLQQGDAGRDLMRKLETTPLIRGSFVGAVAGAVTPFCSCSTVPIFNGLVRANVPFAISMSFLLASPLIDEAGVVMMVTYFGTSYTLTFVVASIMLPSALALALHGLGFSRFMKVAPQFTEPPGFAGDEIPGASVRIPWRARLRFAAVMARSELRQVRLHIVAGVLLGAAIQGLVPDAWIQATTSHLGPIEQVLFMAAAGIPIYLNVIGALPIAAALVAKGIAIGPVSAFLITAVGISLPELTLLSRIFRVPLMAAYVGAVFACAILLGLSVG
jgi:uncharacterized membrane protein YraQ (UPF0718 family)